jgi:hypothetical protein
MNAESAEGQFRMTKLYRAATVFLVQRDAVKAKTLLLQQSQRVHYLATTITNNRATVQPVP